jgi:hypothetical protein
MTCTPACRKPHGRQAHCGAEGCHRTFGSVSGFDAHRRGDADHRHCIDPALITKDGGMHLDRHGIWRWTGVSPNPHARSARESAPQTAQPGPGVAAVVNAPPDGLKTRSGGPEGRP